MDSIEYSFFAFCAVVLVVILSIFRDSNPFNTPMSTSTAHLEMARSSASGLYPQFVLFGDSITEGSGYTLCPELAEYYRRRMDIVNRGLGGYTTKTGLHVLPRFFPANPPSDKNPHVRLMTVFFGANDCVLPGNIQHVPMDDYVENLGKIVTYEGLKLHGTKVILIVPAPVDEWQTGDSRTAVNTAKYATACREFGKKFNLPTVDLWTAFMMKAGWEPGTTDALPGSKDAPKNKVFEDLLSDGLHFTNAGYAIVREELIKVIEKELPDDIPDKIPMVFPDWKEAAGQ